MDKPDLGSRGEQLAAHWYEENGYTILTRNYRTRLGEIDIVAQNGGMVVFIEVKTRAAGAIAPPRAWVNATKQRRIIAAAGGYIAAHFTAEPFVRFDVAEVTADSSGALTLHCIENAFTL